MSRVYTGLEVIDTDHYFVVDSFTREITSKQPQKDILIQNDHNSERFTFEIPRFIEGRDVGLCNVVQVCYTNGKKSGVYTVDDLAIYPFVNDTVICSWLISQNATSVVAPLVFMLRFAQVNGDGTIEYAWSTKTYNNVKIVESLDSVDKFTNEYVDAIQQWKAQVMDETQTYIDAAVEKGLREEAAEYVDEAIANAVMIPSYKIGVDSIGLGENLLSATGWTLGSGWSGSFSRGFTHANGYENTLECAVNSYESAYYVLKFTATNQYSSSTENCLLVSVGGSPNFEQYQDDGTVTKYFTFYPSSGNIVFTPSANWSGVISDIGLYAIPHTSLLDSSLVIRDANDNVSFSVTATDSELNNIIIGRDSLRKVVSANRNIVIGNEALTETATGYMNVAIGNRSQTYSIDGTRNISIGHSTLTNLTYGDRNVAIGTFALAAVTTGRDNVGIGADAGWHTTSGSHNIAISNGALNGNTEGSYNIAIGHFANPANTIGDNNISLGYLSNGYNTIGKHNFAAGYFAHYKGDDDRFNIAIGYQAMSDHGSADSNTDNIAIGRQALKTNVGNYNIAIGHNTLCSSTTETGYNVAIGYDVMSQSVASEAEGSNVVIGCSSGRNIVGTNNVAIGRGALNKACQSNNIAIGNDALRDTTSGGNVAIGLQALAGLSSGTNNIAIGYAAGSDVRDASNCICIGSAGHNTDNGVYIGKLINYNGSTMGLLGLDPVDNAGLLLPAGTKNIAPIKINPGVLTSTTVVGAIEFDGNHLYFVNQSGKRVQLAEA